MVEYLDKRGLSYLWGKVKAKFATKSDLDLKIPFGAALMNTNSFATNNKIYISKTDNVLYSANQRWVVTHKLYDTDGSFLEDLELNLFDCNYGRASKKVKDGTYAVLYIGAVEEANLSSTTNMLWTYGDGYIYLTFYSTMVPTSIEVKGYVRNHSSNAEGWYDFEAVQISTSVWRIAFANNNTYPTAYKITYVGKTTGSYGASLTQVEMYKIRSSAKEQSAVTKYPIQQDLWGNLVAPKFIMRGGTSSQFLKADGSVDSTAYLPANGNAASATKTTQDGSGNNIEATYQKKADVPAAITNTEMDNVLEDNSETNNN